jgi:hypothetical protein
MKNINAEANMAIQNTTSQAAKSHLPALIGFGLLLLRGNALDQAAAHLCHLICTLTGELFKFAPSAILAGCQVLVTYFFAHQQLFLGVQTLLSFWQVLHRIFSAA